MLSVGAKSGKVTPDLELTESHTHVCKDVSIDFRHDSFASLFDSNNFRPVAHLICVVFSNFYVSEIKSVIYSTLFSSSLIKSDGVAFFLC